MGAVQGPFIRPRRGAHSGVGPDQVLAHIARSGSQQWPRHAHNRSPTLPSALAPSAESPVHGPPRIPRHRCSHRHTSASKVARTPPSSSSPIAQSAFCLGPRSLPNAHAPFAHVAHASSVGVGSARARSSAYSVHRYSWILRQCVHSVPRTTPQPRRRATPHFIINSAIQTQRISMALIVGIRAKRSRSAHRRERP